ncbi:MAG TPA: membrane protein insertion efficiency factor YidD, partial [Thiotrichaceae bacterium]|nr:membrane protein insertion efficiency factor YidD [Thiotrichaceae bacterium]
MRKLFAYFISLYQRNISPHKGFTCAHRGLHGGDSCSEYARKKLLEKGTFNCLKAIKQR